MYSYIHGKINILGIQDPKRSIMNISRMVLMCIPADGRGKLIFKVIDDLQLQNHNSLIVFMDVANLPRWINFFQSPLESSEINGTTASDNITSESKKNVLIFANNNTVHLNLDTYVVNSVKKALIALNNDTDDVVNFMLGDFRFDDSLRPLLFVRNANSTDFLVEKVENNLEEWSLKHKQLEECDNCKSDLERTLSVLVILGCSCLFVCVLLAAAALARNQLMKKKVSKGPYKVLLTATDFVFPQIADSRGERINE
ncbi:hypothetical protein NQ317_000510 [Molorchus minor]|uniref:Receptor ligand binding region domain-containing protein n=1 Tax=Molorchus minor TaxID=1323400 RepID=A0ABQ9JP04_9CUCU|nr:hypothetical protein NQ317_000510 [Molorchus minor]